jgi:phytoene dehydrogenase-like protein
MRGNPDAVIVGSGPNGPAAAVTLAAAGLAVQVIEGAPVIGGGCRTQELTRPGFRHDICSAVPSIALASPFFQRFDLKARGVRFARPPVEFAHPLDGGRAAIVSASVAETAARLGADGRSYRRLIGPLASHLDELCQVLLAPLRRPPVLPVTFARYALPSIWPASVLTRLWHTPEARAPLRRTGRAARRIRYPERPRHQPRKPGRTGQA